MGSRAGSWSVVPRLLGQEAARGATAGLLGSLAYSAEMWLDLRLVRYRFNDFTLLGRPFSSNPRIWLPVGATIHLINGMLVGRLYAGVERLLPGPGWLRGVLFAQAENLLLWPLMLLVDRCHPGRRDGSLAPAFTLLSFCVAVLRHLAFGFVLGRAFGGGRRP